MVEITRPRRGSLAYSPRKRAKSQVPKYKSWPEYEGEPKLQGFAGYKAGMTHIIMVDDRKTSPSAGKDITVPVTVIEVPPMKVVAVRAYCADTYGSHAFSEVWSENVDSALSERITAPKKNNPESVEKIRSAIADGTVTDIFALMYTQPVMLTGVPKKVPDLMEVRVAGGDMAARFDFALGLFGADVDIESISTLGQYVDVTAVTTGKGTNGPVKLWGTPLRKSKHSRQGKLRHIGNLGPWHPHHVRWQVPQMGQMGYHQRTEFNQRILKVSNSPEEINPEGGFVKYGLVRGKYIAIKGSVPGPNKRLIRIRPAIRNNEANDLVPVVSYVSTKSKQG